MKIYIDTIIFDIQRGGGISVYWYELINRFLLDKNFEIVLVDSGEKKENPFFKKLNLSDVKVIFEKKVFNRYRSVGYVENETHYFVSTYYRYSENEKAINITVVHDFTYEYYGNGIRKWVHIWQKYAAIQKSKKVICISKNTYNDLRKFINLRAWQDVRVIYNGVGGVYRKMTPIEIEGTSFLLPQNLREIVSQRYFLFVGARSGYKNWNRAVDIFRQLSEEYRMISVGGGQLSEEEKKVLGDAISRHLHLPYVEDETLCLLYNQAVALFYLSEYEGFGIPVAEAQSCGCPVVAMNRSSIHEVAGESALLFDDLPQKIDIEVLKDLKLKVTSTKIFSWDDTYRRFCLFLNDKG